MFDLLLICFLYTKQQQQQQQQQQSLWQIDQALCRIDIKTFFFPYFFPFYLIRRELANAELALLEDVPVDDVPIHNGPIKKTGEKASEYQLLANNRILV